MSLGWSIENLLAACVSVPIAIDSSKLPCSTESTVSQKWGARQKLYWPKSMFKKNTHSKSIACGSGEASFETFIGINDEKDAKPRFSRHWFLEDTVFKHALKCSRIPKNKGQSKLPYRTLKNGFDHCCHRTRLFLEKKIITICYRCSLT